MAPPPVVSALIEALLDGVRAALGNNFVGAYLCGSLAFGGFDPATSDVDVLLVTEHPVSHEEIARLADVVKNLPPSGNHFGLEFEAYFIDRMTVRRFVPGQRHVKIASDEPLDWIEHRPGWVIERWVVRERGVVLAGPDPKSLIDPVSADDLRWAAGEELRARLTNWSGARWPITEMAHLGAQSFEVETVCRAVHTTHTGEAASKHEAVAWALGALPERWHDLIEWSQRHKKEPTEDSARVSEVLDFLAWAVNERLAGY